MLDMTLYPIPMQNPITNYRQLNQLTQEQLANLCHVTPQVVLLAEAGIWTTLPPKLRHVTHVTPKDYHAYQVAKRKANRVQLENAALAFNPPVAGVHPHVNFRLLISGSLMGYCKVLAINPTIVRNYERGSRRRVIHPLIKQYLADAGLEKELISDLEARFENA